MTNLPFVEAFHLLARGQPEPAARIYAEVVDYWEQAGARRNAAMARMWLGQARGQMGRFEEAIESLNEALDTLSPTDWAAVLALSRRSHAYLGDGQIAEARADAEGALGLARQFEYRFAEGEALVALGLIDAASDPPDYAAAEQHCTEGEKLLRECEYRLELAPALRAHGEIRLKTQGLAAAEPLLRESRDLYAYMARQNDVEAIDALLEGRLAGESPAATPG